MDVVVGGVAERGCGRTLDETFRPSLRTVASHTARLDALDTMDSASHIAELPNVVAHASMHDWLVGASR